VTRDEGYALLFEYLLAHDQWADLFVRMNPHQQESIDAVRAKLFAKQELAKQIVDQMTKGAE